MLASLRQQTRSIWGSFNIPSIYGVRYFAKEPKGHPPVTEELREACRARNAVILKKRQEKKGYTFFEVADKQKKWGKGMKLARKFWGRYPEPSFYTVTRVKFAKHGHNAKAWGIKTWRGNFMRTAFNPSIHC